MKRFLLLITLYLLFFSCSSQEFKGFKTDTSKSSIDFKKILSGGPGKDGIPAINSPKFIQLGNATVSDDELGILVIIEGESRFYPYNILVWHEIVNDHISNSYFSVTFCPLCGSGIVFNREVGNKIVTFGVSGLLYESNLLMYDDATESLWSQAKGEAVVGDYLGEKLEIVSASVLTFSQVKEFYPNSKILSEDTGFSRNYNYYPYGNYNENSNLYFPTSGFSDKFHSKEIMYAFKYRGTSFSFPVENLKSKGIYDHGKDKIVVTRERGVISVLYNGKLIPGYYEMWFSWFIHNSENGVVITF